MVGRVVLGERFGAVGIQAEVQAYPRLARRGYLYVAAAVSPHRDVFVPFRAGLEPFVYPGGTAELSAGARLFRTGDTSIVSYTGSIGWYFGNYWFSLRPYATPWNGSVDLAGELAFRRYFAGRYDYVGFYVSGSAGADPVSNDPGRLTRPETLQGYAARIERRRTSPAGDVRFSYGLGVAREEVFNGQHRMRYSLMFGLHSLLP